MSKRLQVLLDEEQFTRYQKIAKRKSMALGEWVRQALERSAMLESTKPAAEKLAALRRALNHDGPTGPIEQMIEETERGYSIGLP